VTGPSIPEEHRREIAHAYERGWGEAIDMAAEVIRGAQDVSTALVRLSVLGRQAVGLLPAQSEPGS